MANKLVFFLLISLTACGKSFAQITPAEGRNLHYRIIGFSFPQQQNAVGYKVEIASGTYSNADSFSEKIIVSADGETNRIVAEVPSFSTSYTWRSVYKPKHGPAVESGLHHFSTFDPDSFGSESILHITKAAEKYTDAYVFLDQSRALYDMNGKPVWYLPTTGEAGTHKVPVRDLKMTSRGTITYLQEGEEVYEINYDGDILWKGPNDGEISGNRKEHYHHEFTRLSNGHYMAMGGAPAIQPNMIHPGPGGNMPGQEQNRHRQQMPGPNNDRGRQNPRDTTGHILNKNPMMSLGTLIEYDEQGKVVWSWKSVNYFTGSDIFYYRDADGQRIRDVHMNSFYFDEQAKVIYVSFKNISRIIKIKYPEGTLLNTYGELYKTGVPMQGNGMFCYQHAIGAAPGGDIYLFNNNSCKPECAPEVVVLHQPGNATENPKKVWEYECPVQSLNLTLSSRATENGESTTGGNVVRLADGSFFVSLCAPYSKLLIVNKDKEILWSAEPARWNPTLKLYTAFPQYRSSIITNREDLEKLIWNTTPGK